MAERNPHDLKDRVVGTKCSQMIFYFKVVTTKFICLAPRFIIQDNYPLPLMITRHLFEVKVDQDLLLSLNLINLLLNLVQLLLLLSLVHVKLS